MSILTKPRSPLATDIDGLHDRAVTSKGTARSAAISIGAPTNWPAWPMSKYSVSSIRRTSGSGPPQKGHAIHNAGVPDMLARDRPDHCTIVVAYIRMIDVDPRTQDPGYDRTLPDSALWWPRRSAFPPGCSTSCFVRVQRWLGSGLQLLPPAPSPPISAIAGCRIHGCLPSAVWPPACSGALPFSDETIGIPKPWLLPAPQCPPGPHAAVIPISPAADRRQIWPILRAGFQPVSNRKRSDFLTNGFGYRFSRGYHGRSFGRIRPSTSERVSA